MLRRFERFNERVSGWAEGIGFAVFFLMLLLTCVDVIGAKVFRVPVFGSIDMMMLGQLVAISCASGMALVRERHVSVEFFVMLFPTRVRGSIECLAHLLSFGLCVLIVWRLATHGYHLQLGGENTPTARIPISPFAYIAALATVPLCLVFLQRALSSLMKAVGHES
jgi:TRAP-type C4-dicarboxylate transport system permease small subunit